MTDIKAEFEKADWAMSQSDYNSMVARASTENAPSLIKTEIDGATLRVFVHGPIVKTHDLFSLISGGVSSEDISKAILAEGQHTETELDFDSGGGDVRAAEPVLAAIAASKVPVKSHVSGVCASLAYWIASATKSISATPNSIVGGIGVVTKFIEDESVVRSQNAQNKNTLADAQQRTNAIEAQFIADIAKGRSKALKNPLITAEHVINNYGQGMAFVAKDAKAKDMIDSITDSDTAAAAATQQESRMTKPESGAVNISAEDLEARDKRIAEKSAADAVAALLAEQKQEREAAEAEQQRIDNEALIRKNKIEASLHAKDKPEATAKFFEAEGAFATFTAEQAIAMLETMPTEANTKSFAASAAEQTPGVDASVSESGAFEAPDAEAAATQAQVVAFAVDEFMSQGMSRTEAELAAKESLSAALSMSAYQ